MHPVVDELRDVVGVDHVLVDDDVRAGFEIDWTGRYGGRSLAVVRPSTTAEVAATVVVCRDRDVAMIPQGGNTGLVGGSVPRASLPDHDGTPNQIVISMKRLDAVGAVDTAAMQITVGAGVTLADWRRAARRHGVDTPIDFAARESATVGGAISTNAGGSRVVRFGTMRQQIVGVEVVLPDGSIAGSLAGLPKETAGLHWPSLMCGAEGTLGIVTNARLKVVPWYQRTTTAMIALDSIDAALQFLAALRATVESLDSIEVIQPDALVLVARHLGANPPVDVAPNGTVLIVECAAHDDPTAVLVSVLAETRGVTGTAITSEPVPRSSLLAFRDRLTEAIAVSSTEIGIPTFKLDVAVPLERLDDLLALASAVARGDGCRLVAFGHLAEGNLHLNHLGARDPATLANSVLKGVSDMGGTISAEHGIGVAKAAYMHLIRSQSDLAAQRAIATALDPKHLLNPGVLGRNGTDC
jgi:FAD/FMN-containing dehydrogenase